VCDTQGWRRRSAPPCGRDLGPHEGKDFAQSPEGKKLTEEVKEQASKPENRRKLKEFGQRFMKKR
jgi:hypothetical protein